jgi:uncharacterized protein YqgC (DUF456 family)
LDVVIIVIGFIFALSGIFGCVLPIIPGPAFSFLALILLSWTKNWQAFSPTFLIVMGSLTALLIILDYIAPALGAKKYGASKPGLWGSAIGMIIGIFFIPPWGIIVGAFVGALVGLWSAKPWLGNQAKKPYALVGGSLSEMCWQSD